MILPHYELLAENSLMVFEFISEGPNGRILKLIKFSETALDGIYNLGFGDKNLENGDIDDTVVSNNGDSEKVLATVVSAVFTFTDYKKEAWVYATGSTKSRTRLYRMGIVKYFIDVKQHFYIFGLLNDEWEPFEQNVDYTAFVVKRK